MMNNEGEERERKESEGVKRKEGESEVEVEIDLNSPPNGTIPANSAKLLDNTKYPNDTRTKAIKKLPNPMASPTFHPKYCPPITIVIPRAHISQQLNVNSSRIVPLSFFKKKN